MTAIHRETAGTAPAVDAARGRAGDSGLVGVVDGPADRDALLGAIGTALAFPSYYGRNLDALEELLRDLSWLPLGPVELVWADGPLRAADPSTHAAVVDILDGAVTATAGTDRPLSVTLAGPPA